MQKKEKGDEKGDVNTTGKNLDDKKLRNLGLFMVEHGTLHPTNAAILLSGSPERKRLFPFAKIECARFKGTETKIFLDQVSIDGPIHTAIEPFKELKKECY